MAGETLESTSPEKRKWYRRCQCGNRMSRRSKSCMDCLYKRPEIKQPDDASIRHVPLSGGMVAVVDAGDYERIMKHRWSARKVSRKNGSLVYYAVSSMLVNDQYKQIAMHRFVIDLFDPKILVDHWNGNGLDNTRGNIRVATNSQNQANRKMIRGLNGYKGVERIKAKPGRRRYEAFRGVITVNGQRFVSPYYRDARVAAQWYDEKAREFFGEFAHVNFAQSHQNPSPA